MLSFASGILIATFPCFQKKKAILETLVAMHKFDVICSSYAVLNNTYDQDYKKTLVLKLISIPYLE